MQLVSCYAKTFILFIYMCNLCIGCLFNSNSLGVKSYRLGGHGPPGLPLRSALVGVIFDKKLTFEDHVRKLCKKVSN